MTTSPPAAPIAPPQAEKAAKDTVRPITQALGGSLVRGKAAALRFELADNSGKAGATATLSRGRAVIARLSWSLRAVRAGKIYELGWKPSASLKTGPLAFCVIGRDAAGNASSRSCATVRVRAAAKSL